MSNLDINGKSRVSGKKLNWIAGIDVAFDRCIAWLGIPLAHRARASEITRFLIGGVIATLVQLVFLYVFTEYAHLWYVASSVLAFMFAFGTSFILQKYWTFRNNSREKIPTQFAFHLGTSLFMNLGLNTLFLYVLVEFLGMWYILAQFVVSAVIAVAKFIALKWVFRP